MPRSQPIIAIDGPSGSGKSTVSKMLARRLGYVYLDTGAMYRCVGLLALRQGLDPLSDEALSPVLDGLAIRFELGDGETQKVFCNDQEVTLEIRRPEVSQAASKASSRPLVREKLVAMQRKMGARGGVVMEGRDIGTNVFPHADFKFFVTASAVERARRRFLELQARGDRTTYEDVLADQLERDKRDSERELNPLIQAPDAILIDTSNMSIDTVVEALAAVVEDRFRTC